MAAGVLLDHETLARRDRIALGLLNDSKMLSPEEREQLYPVVMRTARSVAVDVRCVKGIDSRGLHVTNIAALARCLERVAVDGAVCLSDGFRLSGCAVEHRAVIEGDSTSAAIAAASIIAKVTRDRYMHRADGAYPGWDFAGNVGYSTPEHRAAIREVGISVLHRRSFNSIAYSQLALGGDVVPEDLEHESAASEGVADVLVGRDLPVAPEHYPDHVEAERADAA